jgi:hypothetical protein
VIEDFGPFWHFIVRAPRDHTYYETVEPRGAQKAVDAGLIEKMDETDGPLGPRVRYRLTRNGHRQRIFEQVLAEKLTVVREEYERRLNPPLLRTAS